NGESLNRWGGFTNGHSYGRRYGTKKASCSACPLKSNCISENQDRRELNIYDGVNVPETEKMREKIDSKEGRKIYSKRMSIIEPVFGNIRFNKGLDYFSLRTKAKVNIQWLLWCMVHNIEKIVTKGKFNLL
ncbi:MAG: transposase, partial [Leptospiraceae bacterium]|nr:transposase [Leptospiraceae bacterium]